MSGFKKVFLEHHGKKALEKFGIQMIHLGKNKHYMVSHSNDE